MNPKMMEVMVGRWGVPSAAIDWCEKNYNLTLYGK
jgi:hypothetical protein